MDEKLVKKDPLVEIAKVLTSIGKENFKSAFDGLEEYLIDAEGVRLSFDTKEMYCECMKYKHLRRSISIKMFILSVKRFLPGNYEILMREFPVLDIEKYIYAEFEWEELYNRIIESSLKLEYLRVTFNRVIDATSETKKKLILNSILLVE